MRNKYEWIVPPSTLPDLSELQTLLIGAHPLLAQVLARRGIVDPAQARAFLDPTCYSPTPPAALPDLEKASQHLLGAVQNGSRVLVWGDFDVDGQTASALLVDALTRLGLPVSLYIPDRITESHGIHLDTLKAKIEETHPDLLLTCDTGISAHESVDYAKSAGLVTLVTDHHDLPLELPNADALVNPKRLPSDHPLASLPGVGVAYKLIEHLYTQLDRAHELPRFLDLVALGIVADVARQTHDTRYLLQIGLDRLQNTERIGLQTLMSVAGIDPRRVTATDIGFQLGPRLNAAGRLANASLAVDLLSTTDPAKAQILAAQLEGLNNQRRLQTQQITAAAQEQIERDNTLLDWGVLVLSSPSWHPGILGIVANRLAEQYACPVVLLNTANPTVARGSARSVPGVDIGAAIAAQSDLLLSHGGHPGAAGLSLHPDLIPTFRRRLAETIRQSRARDSQARPTLLLDATVPLSELSLDLAVDLDRLAPFGEGNPRVTLLTPDLTLASAAYVGRSKEHRRLTVVDFSGQRQTVMWWNGGSHALPQGVFDLAYQLEISTFQDQTELQLVFVDVRPSLSVPVELAPPPRQVIDHRTHPNPSTLLPVLRAQYSSCAVWAEGFRQAESPGVPLYQLPPADALIVYTIPAGPQPLQEALERVNAHILVFLAVEPPFATPSTFLRRVMELVKHVMSKQSGRTSLAAIAGATAHTESTVRLALELLAARGDIVVSWKRGGLVELAHGDRLPIPDSDAYAKALHDALIETAAYRAYYRRATPAQLLGEDS